MRILWCQGVQPSRANQLQPNHCSKLQTPREWKEKGIREASCWSGTWIIYTNRHVFYRRVGSIRNDHVQEARIIDCYEACSPLQCDNANDQMQDCIFSNRLNGDVPEGSPILIPQANEGTRLDQHPRWPCCQRGPFLNGSHMLLTTFLILNIDITLHVVSKLA